MYMHMYMASYASYTNWKIGNSRGGGIAESAKTIWSEHQTEASEKEFYAIWLCAPEKKKKKNGHISVNTYAWKNMCVKRHIFMYCEDVYL